MIHRQKPLFSHLLATIILICGIWLLIVLQQRVEASAEVTLTSAELLWAPDYRVQHILALAEDNSAADALWIRSVFYLVAQKFEEKQKRYAELQEQARIKGNNVNESISQDPSAGNSASNFEDFKFTDQTAIVNALFWNSGSEDARHFLHLLNVITDLDSMYITPYVQGALNLAMMAGRHEEALEILTKGARMRPDRWEMPYYTGFIQMFYLDDKHNAADNIQAAAMKKDVPLIIVQLAAALQAGLGKREMTVEFLRTIYELTEDVAVKEKIENLLFVYGSNIIVRIQDRSRDINSELDKLLKEL